MSKEGDIKKLYLKHRLGITTQWDSERVNNKDMPTWFVSAMLEYHTSQSQEESKWISVKDKLPKESQIVDVWQTPGTQSQNNSRGLENTNLYHKSQFTGWRSTNYKYSLIGKGKMSYSSFEKVNEKTFEIIGSRQYKQLIVENGEVTHWKPLPPKP